MAIIFVFSALEIVPRAPVARSEIHPLASKVYVRNSSVAKIFRIALCIFICGFLS